MLYAPVAMLFTVFLSLAAPRYLPNIFVKWLILFPVACSTTLIHKTITFLDLGIPGSYKRLVRFRSLLMVWCLSSYSLNSSGYCCLIKSSSCEIAGSWRGVTFAIGVGPYTLLQRSSNCSVLASGVVVAVAVGVGVGISPFVRGGGVGRKRQLNRRSDIKMANTTRRV
jgi:hypothetical protein